MPAARQDLPAHVLGSNATVRGWVRCCHQPGNKAATSQRLFSYPPLSVKPVECLPRSYDIVENVPAVLRGNGFEVVLGGDPPGKFRRGRLVHGLRWGDSMWSSGGPAGKVPPGPFGTRVA
jgi:hypothetical protein